MAEEPTERPAIPDPFFLDRPAGHDRGTSPSDESESLRIGPWVPVPRAVRSAGQRLQIQGRAVRTVRLSITAPPGPGATGVERAPRATARGSAPRSRRARRAAGVTAGGLRRWGREHLALVSVAAVAVVLVLFSVPFLSDVRRTGNPDGRTAAPGPLPAASPSIATPAAPPAPPTSEQSLGARPPAKRQSTSPPPARKPDPPPSRPAVPPPPQPVRPRPPVLIGPESPGELFDLLMRYCDNEYGKSEAQLRDGIDPATDNWVCKAQGDEKVIDMTAACRFEYGRQAFARFTDARNAFSWGCYRR